MTYVNPYVSDREFINGDSRLSRKQARDDLIQARAEDGIAAAIFTKPHNPAVMPAWAKHPAHCRCRDCCPCGSCRNRRSIESEED
ncbi:hypothetical protein [Nocardioides sp.]|uniref:hypothetical protein n=1 Tax=Nocardioides sp. TaxID=35761 RepID=UPI002D18C1E1|nr:hypothetical protein [Nocardioides sp.]HSX68453.1 hypothetical protein [Nocardioides sp.]